MEPSKKRNAPAVDSRFSAQAFAEAELDSDEARKLADELSDEITNQLTEVMCSRLSEIVAQLNAMGHNLSVFDSSPGSVSYRDELRLGNHSSCRLRLAVDVVISTGYAHLLEHDP
jgi:hypothetical protein